MLNTALENDNYVITSNRKSRQESPLIIALYFAHLFLTFFYLSNGFHSEILHHFIQKISKK